MFQTIDDFLRYFRSVHKRAVRDVAALPPEADGWSPGLGEGENAWNINTLVGHLCSSRLYFASAFRDEGWLSPEPPDVSSQDKWIPALEQSYDDFVAAVGQGPPDWLTRRVKMIDTDGELAGWRVLLMMMEHDIHHRSQIDTYAGVNGWPVPDIYGRSAEQVGLAQESQRDRS
ncbi:MAG TPA: DinB family protein [Dehalococcoidia bacterium]|nr:DinB family protein [Dehalococcoidia bacterium]